MAIESNYERKAKMNVKMKKMKTVVMKILSQQKQKQNHANKSMMSMMTQKLTIIAQKPLRKNQEKKVQKRSRNKLIK